MATTPIGRRLSGRRRGRARRRPSLRPLLARVEAGMTGTDAGGLEDLVDAVGALVAARVPGVVLRVAHQRGDLLPGRGRTFALHEPALHVDEIGGRWNPVRV